MNILTCISLFFLLAVALMLGAAAAFRTVRRNLSRRRGAFAALAALAAACTILAQKTSISFDRLISDAGSYATNDVLHVAATNAAAYAAFDFTDSDLLVYRRERGLTNAADWVECLPRRKYGDQPADWHVPDATNYDYLIAVDYVPPSPVHTNGVFELRGFVVPSAAAGTRSAAFATSTIADRREIVPVEYLESTGTQWIDTGIARTPTSGSIYKLSCMFNYPETATRQIQGAQSSFYFGVINGKFQPGLGGSGTVNYSVDPNRWYYLEIIFDTTSISARQRYTINGSSGSTNNGFSNQPPNATFWFFAANNATTLRSKCKISKCAVCVDDTIVRDFIPVRVGKVGYMYDRMSGQLFGNQGTGAFIVGPDMKE